MNPLAPLPIVKRVFLGSRTGQGFEKKNKGVHLDPLGGDVAPPKVQHQAIDFPIRLN